MGFPPSLYCGGLSSAAFDLCELSGDFPISKTGETGPPFFRHSVPSIKITLRAAWKSFLSFLPNGKLC